MMNPGTLELSAEKQRRCPGDAGVYSPTTMSSHNDDLAYYLRRAMSCSFQSEHHRDQFQRKLPICDAANSSRLSNPRPTTRENVRGKDETLTSLKILQDRRFCYPGRHVWISGACSHVYLLPMIQRHLHTSTAIYASSLQRQPSIWVSSLELSVRHSPLSRFEMLEKPPRSSYDLCMAAAKVGRIHLMRCHCDRDHSC
jgi:plasmid maintenance system killer protein